MNVFLEDDFVGACDLGSTSDVHKKAASLTSAANGLKLEFGSATGESARSLIAGGIKKLYGFDWFLGLPIDWKGHVEVKGAFSTNGVVPEVAGVEFIVGLFEDTLPGFMNLHEEPVSLVHFDCDLYESTAYVFANIEARIEVGCVLIFDEFYGYPSWKIHEYRAFMEHMSRTNYVYEMVGRSNDMQRFMFRRTA